MRKPFFILTILTLLLTSCGGNATPSAPASSGAVKAVETYLNAIISKKLETVKNASCAAWEKDAKVDFDSFQAVTAKLDGLACQETGKEGKYTTVNCKGKIIATYQNENQTLDLSKNIYLVAEEGGAWKMCGYK